LLGRIGFAGFQQLVVDYRRSTIFGGAAESPNSNNLPLFSGPTSWKSIDNPNGYRMGQANSHRESGYQRGIPGMRAHPEVHSRPPKMAEFLGFQARLSSTESVARNVLAEREELWSNPLRRDFNDLRTTQVLMDVD